MINCHRISLVMLLLVATLSHTTALAAPDLILINGDVYTVDPNAPRVEGFAVENGKFTALGRSSEMRALADSETTVIDAGGKSVTPGLIDGHAHVSGDSPAVAGVDLSYIADKDEWLGLIEEADQRMAEGEWITGGYWDHTLGDGQYPTKEMLDEVVPDRPVMLRHIDGHYGWVNSLALDMAEVTAKTPVPAGGEIVVDPTTREPTGILLEGAQSIVSRIIPERSDEQRRTGLAEMYRYANSFGITGLHQMGGLEDYLHVVEKGDPTLRVWYGQRSIGANPTEYDAGVKQYLTVAADTAQRVAATGKQQKVGPLLEAGFV